MQFQSLQCPVCLHEYDLDNHLPRIVPQCGHSICSPCLSSLIGTGAPKCPFDNRPFDYQQKNVDTFPINFSLRGLLEEKLELEVCDIHGSYVEFFCQTDKSRLCGHCALDKEHKDHEINALRTLKVQCNQKTRKLETVFQNLNKYHKDLDGVLENSKLSLLKTIEENFEKLIAFAKKKKMELALEINSFFNKERNRLENSIGKSSVLINKIQAKMSEYKDILVSDVKEDDILLKSAFALDYGTFRENAQSFNEQLKEKIAFFEKCLASQMGAINCLEFSNEDILEKLKAIYPKDIEDFMPEKLFSQNGASTTVYSFKEIKSVFDINLCDGYLQVTGSDQKHKIFKINLDRLSKITDFRLTLDDFNIREEELDVLQNLYKEMKQVKCIHINTRNQEKKLQNYLPSLFCTILNEPQCIEDFSLNLRYTQIGDDIIQILMRNFLPKMCNLKALKLYLRETKITDKSVEAFALNVLPLLPNLESFKLDLQGTRVTETSVNQIFTKMPAVRFFELGLSSTQIGDKTLEIFVKNTLTTMMNLESLEIYLYRTKVTDAGIIQLLDHVPNVKKLVVDLHSTLITDTGILPFIQNKLPQMSALRIFCFELSSTHVTDKTKAEVWKISTALPN